MLEWCKRGFEVAGLALGPKAPRPWFALFSFDLRGKKSFAAQKKLIGQPAGRPQWR